MSSSPPSKVADGGHEFHDTLALQNCGRWRVRLDTPQPGLIIEALDDAGAFYDRVELRRYGAYIVVDRPPLRRVIPDALRFLEPLLEMKARAQAIGLPIEIPPVLVHSSRIEGLFEMGYMPAALRPEIGQHGNAKILGVDVVWHQELDRYAVVL